MLNWKLKFNFVILFTECLIEIKDLNFMPFYFTEWCRSINRMKPALFTECGFKIYDVRCYWMLPVLFYRTFIQNFMPFDVTECCRSCHSMLLNVADHLFKFFMPFDVTECCQFYLKNIYLKFSMPFYLQNINWNLRFKNLCKFYLQND